VLLAGLGLFVLASLVCALGPTIGLGQALETSPLPMPLLIAGAGVTALVLFLASARARQA
jgi:hypothetical protein